MIRQRHKNKSCPSSKPTLKENKVRLRLEDLVNIAFK